MTILMAISKWAVDNLGVKESLKDIGTEVLERFVFNPLKQKIAVIFRGDNLKADSFLEEISKRQVSDTENLRDEFDNICNGMHMSEYSNDLFNSIASFFENNQEMLRRINVGSAALNKTINNNQYANKIVNAETIITNSFSL